MTVAAQPKIKERPMKTALPRLQGAVKEVFLITNAGLDELIGNDAIRLEEKIQADKEHSIRNYRYFDDDKRTWAYWAVEDAKGHIQPITPPIMQQYSTTSPQLYTKAVVFPQIVARIVGKLKEVPPTLWDKMMKPATIVLAIFGIIIVVAMFMVAAQG